MAILPPAKNLSSGISKGQVIEGSIRSLNTKEFLHWLEKDIAGPLIAQLQRATEVRAVMLDLFDLLNHPETRKEHGISFVTSAADPETLESLRARSSSEYYDQITLDNENVAIRLCETAHKELAKVIQLRSEQHIRVQLPDFVLIAQFIQSFMEDTEKYSQRQSMELRGVWATQERAYIKNFHNSRVSTIALILDNEEWTQAEVAQEFQNLAHSLFHPESSEEGAVNVPKPATTSTGIYFILQVDGDEYCVVNSALMLLKMLSEYLECALAMPELVHDVVNSIVEILKVPRLLPIYPCELTSQRYGTLVPVNLYLELAQ